MKKLFFILFILSFNLSSCGLPTNYYSKGAKKHKDGTIKAKKHADKVKVLEISGYTDTIFPNEVISHYTKLESLTLTSSKILFYSEKQYESDKYIDSLESIASSFKLKIFKGFLDSLKNLERLGLYDFYAPHFPLELCSLKMLKELRLQLFNVNYFSNDLSNFQNLEFLEITGFGRSEMPAEIIFPPKLKELTLWIKISPETANSINNSNIERLTIYTYFMGMSLDEKVKLAESLSSVDNLKNCKIYLESCEEKAVVKKAIKNKNLNRIQLLVRGEVFCL